MGRPVTIETKAREAAKAEEIRQRAMEFILGRLSALKCEDFIASWGKERQDGYSAGLRDRHIANGRTGGRDRLADLVTACERSIKRLNRLRPGYASE